MADKLELKPWDVTEYLDSEEMIAEYLAAAFEEGDSQLIRVALNNVARARGMSDLQKETGLSRSALYKALGEGGNPTLDTLLAILKALGVKMSVVGGGLKPILFGGGVGVVARRSRASARKPLTGIEPARGIPPLDPLP